MFVFVLDDTGERYRGEPIHVRYIKNGILSLFGTFNILVRKIDACTSIKFRTSSNGITEKIYFFLYKFLSASSFIRTYKLMYNTYLFGFSLFHYLMRTIDSPENRI